MNAKLIFLDIDGTLTLPLEKPSPFVKEGVKKAREAGHKVFICTGRNLPIIGRDILTIGFDGVIASAGAYIEVEGEVIFSDSMPWEKVKECLALFHDSHVYCRIEDENGIYIDEEMEKLLKEADIHQSNSELIRMQREISSSIHIQPFSAYSKKGAYKICFTCTDLNQLTKPRKALEDEFVFVTYPFKKGSSIYNGEIIRRGLDKGDAIKRICEYYRVPLEDTIAFGDSMNDFSMIKTAHIGVAMENGDVKLKEAADFVCKSVEEDGIYHAFKSLGIIK